MPTAEAREVTKVAVFGLAFWALVLVIGLSAVFDRPEVSEPDRSGVGVADNIFDVANPVSAGEPPPGFHQLMGRDDIRPIYEPEHLGADEVDWRDDTLVIGVVIDDEAVAYPVRTLDRREIVNDRLAGTPILATW